MRYLLKSIKWKIKDWIYYHSNIYIEFNIFKLWRYYWSARKYFLAPNIVKHKLKVDEGLGSDYFFLMTDCNNKWFHLSFHPCEWKSKFGDVRFESVPYACLILFNRVKYIWGLEAPIFENYKGNWSRNNLLYWEGVLGYSINYNKDILETYNNNIWVRTYYQMYKPKGQDEYDRIDIQDTIFNGLTYRGKKKILKYQKFKREQLELNKKIGI